MLSLGGGCVQHGVVLHEVLHSLGLWHEQSRLDRDDHVRIRWENIRTGLEDNFAKYQGFTSHRYDIGSIMHYRPDAFSSNNLPTIEPLRSAGNTIYILDSPEWREQSQSL